MVQQKSLHFDRVYVLATHLEQVFVPPQEADLAVVAPSNHITGMKPPFRVHSLGGLLRLFVIPLSHCITSHAQFSHSIGRDGLASGRVNHLELVSGQSMAGAETAVVLGAVQEGPGGATAHFSHAPAADGGSQQLLGPPRHHFAACHAHRQQTSAQSVPVDGLTEGMGGQVVKVGVEAVDDSNPLLLDEAEGFLCIEQSSEDHPSAGVHEHQTSLVEAESVEEGQVHQNYIPGSDAHPVGRVGYGADDIVVVHGSLGEPSGARGIHDRGRFIWVHLLLPLLQSPQGYGIRRCDNIGPAMGSWVGAVTDDQDPLQLREVFAVQVVGVAILDFRAHLADHLQILNWAGTVYRDQGGTIGLADHVLQLGSAEAGVDGHYYRSYLSCAIQDMKPLRPVGHPERDFLPGLNAQLDQSPGSLVNVLPKLGKAPPLPLEVQRLPWSELVSSIIHQGA